MQVGQAYSKFKAPIETGIQTKWTFSGFAAGLQYLRTIELADVLNFWVYRFLRDLLERSLAGN